MREEIVARLRRLNREFYQTFAEPFASTRQRVQPGVAHVVERIPAQAAVLDLGCGSGALADELARRGHRGPYLGLDASPGLLERARTRAAHPNSRFLLADLLEPGWSQRIQPTFDWACAFALLHHLPGYQYRLQFCLDLHDILPAKGTVALSNWNFTASARLQERVVPWSAIGMRAAQVEPGDSLLDWRHGGQGLRYVHLFSEAELAELASRAGFQVLETFYSDGEGARLGLYQIWRKEPPAKP